MSSSEHLNADAFECPECGASYLAFLLTETSDDGFSRDGTVMAWTEEGRPVRIAEGSGWDVQERDLSEEEIEESRQAHPDGVFYCGQCDHYFDEPIPAT